MQRNIELIKRIQANLYEPCKELLHEYNLWSIFAPLYIKERSILESNILTCFIVHAYDNDSQWLNIKQDRIENKWRILKSLGADIENPKFRYVVTNENSEVNDIISAYLIEQTTWKWQYIMHRLDNYAKMMRFATQDTQETKTDQKLVGSKDDKEVKSVTTEYSQLDLARIHQEKASLFKEAYEARKEIDQLLLEIQKDYVQLDNAISKDFGFQVTDEKSIDPNSWSQFIKKKNAIV